MPNHVTTRVRIIASDVLVKQIREEIRPNEPDEDTDAQVIDFEKIAPFPKELEGFSSPAKILTQEEYDAQEADIATRIANDEMTPYEKVYGFSRGITKEMSEKFIKEFGADNWYDWNCQNWGTKWKAYGQTDGHDDTWFEFQTAWSHPTALMQKLARKYPEAIFVAIYADEDIGSNCGAKVYANEQTYCEYPDEDEAIAFAHAVQNGCDTIETISSYIECDEDEEDAEYPQNLKDAIALLESDEKSNLLKLALNFGDADVTFLTYCLE